MRLLPVVSRALALCGTLAVLASACSSTPEGTGGSGAGGGNGSGGGNTGCTGAFCLDDDQKPGVTPAQISFAPQSPGTTAEAKLKVTNLGARGTLQVKAMSFDPVNPEFTVDFKPQSLAPQASLEVTVRYTPTSTSATSTTLHIDSNAVDAGLQRVSVPVKVSGASNGLLFDPNPCHFGNTGKAGADKTVSLINTATLPVQIKTLNLAPMGSADITIAESPDLSKAIEPGGSMQVNLRYQPTGGDKDTTTLQVETATGVKGSVLVTGQEIAPDIVVIPPKVNFGAVALQGDFSQTIKVKNQGLAPLKVANIAVFPPAMAGQIEVTGAKPPFELGPDGSQVLQVVLHTKGQPMPNDGAPIAALKVASDDPGTPDVSVPLFAHSDLGVLLVSPPDELLFGNVGKNVTSKKDVSLFNKGTAPLQVQSVVITDDALGEFAVVAKPSLPADLAPNEQQFVTIAFTNKGPADSAATAVLRIKSQDAAKPDWAVKLSAYRMMGATCQIVASPQPLNFGLLPYGMAKSLPVTLTNKGTGYCQFEQATAYDCYEAPSIQFPGQQVAPKCKGSKSPYYTVGAPSTKLFNLGPNDSGQLIVHFEAPETLGDGLFSQGKAAKVTDVPGLLLVSFINQSDGSQVKIPLGFSTTQADKTAPTLWAKVGKADVKVMPSDIDFGIVSVGCKAPTETVTIYNTGTTNVYVTKAELQGCGPEVDAVNWPAIPKTGVSVTTQKPMTLQVKYGPQNTGKDTCALVVYTDMAGTCGLQNGSGGSGKACTGDSTPIDCAAGEFCKGTQFTVPLVGEGTLDTEWTDEFVQGTGKKVDVLFVIDDSGSMGNKQAELSSNFSQFVQIATLWKNDYHIGVVTTDMTDGNKSGKLQQTGGVRIVTPADKNATGNLLKLVMPGANGSGDEQGLAAAEAALTAPLISSTTTACQTDADCKGVGGSCVTGADDGKKFCGGHNRTFLRKNASLEVVVLSDEEDSSPSDVNYYANLFYSLHGAGNKNLFHFHAISGDPGKGCQANGGADAGNRYYDLVQKTGGKWGSICANDYAQFLKDIGNAAFGLAEQYFLTRTPEPSTIAVKINGKPCAVGAKTWSYDAASNSVSFVPQAQGGQCMPQEGDKISIYYKMLCFP